MTKNLENNLTDSKLLIPTKVIGKSPWGNETYKEKPVRPLGIRPGEENGIPEKPRPYTEVLSYDAHIYFDEDTYQKAATLRKWIIERFPVELGNWNDKPRGPHVTPSFYFGFTNDLIPIIIPWLNINSLGLTILLHPNTDSPKADHTHYTMWINRTQTVIPTEDLENSRKAIGKSVRPVFPNIIPTVPLEL